MIAQSADSLFVNKCIRTFCPYITERIDEVI